jgi:hypothetical protein
LTFFHLVNLLTKKYPALLKDAALLPPILAFTDYGRPVRKSPLLHGQKSNPNPKFLGMAEAHFVCHIGPRFQISLIYSFIGCP